MWNRSSLKTRLVLMFGLILFAALSLNVARLFEEAGPRVAAEDESGIRLATDFVRSAVPAIDAAPDPGRALSALVKSLRNLRHITVSLESEPGRPPLSDADEVPSWFVALVRPETITATVDIIVDGHKRDTIVISSNPLDEIGEIWDGIVSQVLIGGALALALLTITFFTVDRALAPMADLSDAIDRIGRGQYDVRIPAKGPPDLARMCGQVNHLALVLGAAVDEKRRLAERIVSLQDDERRDIARELHDEFGPYLFAIRAHASALARGCVAEGASPEIRGIVQAIGEQVDALQTSNRRVLAKLRPAALDDLGLEAALSALLAGWSETRPGVEVDLRVEADLDDLDGTTSLTVYRVIQEGLTNAFRHADATRVDLCIDTVSDALRIRMSDDGVGLPEDFRDGLGLRGMKERLAALSGRLRIDSSSDGGVLIEAIIPEQRQP